MIPTNTPEYARNYALFFRAVKEYTRKNGKQSITKEVMKSILSQAVTKFHLQIRNNKVVPPSKPIPRPQRPEPQTQTHKKAPSRPMRPFWIP